MTDARPHPEFLELAAARLAGLLDATEEARLERHLGTCDPCRTQEAGYEADRRALRNLRAAAPTPPSDLWARTSAALDREARSTRSRARPAGSLPRPWVAFRLTRGAYAAALAALVILAVIGSGVVPGLVGPGGSFVATATPLAVEPGVIAYVSTRDGDVGVYMGRIDSVCPEAYQANCQPIDSDVTKVASFAGDFVPQQLSVSPDGRQAAVTGTSATGGAVYAVRFPELAQATPHPTASAPTEATPSGSTRPTPSSETVGPTVTVVPSLDGEPEAIIDHVIVVGEPPAYSSDGAMLAFSAMPVDGSAGPDIYVWRIDDQAMDQLTHDGDSIFASWAGRSVVGSRAEPVGDPADASTASPVSFVLDPATGRERPLARAAWRPIVDPTGHNVIYWDGTLSAAPGGRLWNEKRGGLYLAPWSLFDPGAEPIATPAPSPEPTPTVTSEPTPAAESPTLPPTASASPSASLPSQVPTGPPTGAPSESPSPTATATAGASPTASAAPTPSTAPAAEPIALFEGRDYGSDPIVSWEARWSPDGETFGAWVGAARGRRPEVGSLTVGALDRATGRIDPERYQLKEAPAVRGFALGNHRIAWATLPGTDGKSEVRVLVWTDTGRGYVRTTPSGNDSLPAL